MGGGGKRARSWEVENLPRSLIDKTFPYNGRNSGKHGENKFLIGNSLGGVGRIHLSKTFLVGIYRRVQLAWEKRRKKKLLKYLSQKYST